MESYWASLAKLVNISKDGKSLRIFSDILGIANLIALLKKDGGIRPIAVSLTWQIFFSWIQTNLYTKRPNN